MTDLPPSDPSPDSAAHAPASGAKTRIVDALMALAAERRWEDISISEIAARAGVNLAEFRDCFPSKGAVFAAFTRRIDRTVLEGVRDDLVGEPVKERLFDILMRRLDAMAPYKHSLESVLEWARRDPLAAAALNRSALNSMRFMLEAAGVDTEGAVGVIKLQGLVLAWSRVLASWLRDEDPGLARTMAALDRELTRGASIVARVEDVDRLVTPLRAMARSIFERRRRTRDFERRERRDRRNRRDERDERDDGTAAIV
jgi:AcrR family transcriptional regulator